MEENTRSGRGTESVAEGRIDLAKDGVIARITVSREGKLNAMTSAMYRELARIMDEVALSDEVRVVILQGAGKNFSAGFDLHEQVGDGNPYERWQFIKSVANSNRWKIWTSAKPVIAKVRGYCLGGALELALCADFVYAASDAVLGETEIEFGSGPAFLIIPWLVGMYKAKELLLLGSKVTGAEAALMGLVTRAVGPEQLDGTVDATAKRLAQLPVPMVQMLKQGINRTYEIQGLRAAIEGWADSAVLGDLLETEEMKTFGDLVRRKGLRAALDWRRSRFDVP